MSQDFGGTWLETVGNRTLDLVLPKSFDIGYDKRAAAINYEGTSKSKSTIDFP